MVSTNIMVFFYVSKIYILIIKLEVLNVKSFV